MLVNNAGVVQGKKILDLSEEEVNEFVDVLPLGSFSDLLRTDKLVRVSPDRTIGVNLAAQFWILKAFLPKMIEKGTGHVVSSTRSVSKEGSRIGRRTLS